MLTNISDYLYERSSGCIGSLFTLVNRGCYQAIRTGEEYLTPGLLEGIRIDEAAEQARRGLAAGFAAGRLTSRPSRLRAPGKPAARRVLQGER